MAKPAPAKKSSKANNRPAPTKTNTPRVPAQKTKEQKREEAIQEEAEEQGYIPGSVEHHIHTATHEDAKRR